MTPRAKHYDAETSAEIHRRVTLENWSDEPDLMHYTFLRLSEFFPHAIVHRGGPVAPLDIERIRSCLYATRAFYECQAPCASLRQGDVRSRSSWRQAPEAAQSRTCSATRAARDSR